MLVDGSLLSPVLRKLDAAYPLSEAEKSALMVSARRPEAHAAGAFIDGFQNPSRQAFILSGWACQMRLMTDGRRQIFSFLIPGDPITRRGRSEHARLSLVALTPLRTIDLSGSATADEAGRQAIATAIAEAERLEDERVFDHIVRLGRQTAFERMAHMLLEFRQRLEVVGLARSGRYNLPLTQEHLADALGLSIVHANRTLQQLRREGLIAMNAGAVTLLNPGRMAAIADYDHEDYRSTAEAALSA